MNETQTTPPLSGHEQFNSQQKKEVNDMFGNLEEQQQQMEEKLRTVVVHGSSGDGAVKVTANAAQDVTDISIDGSKLDTNDTDQLEDLVLLAVQEALENAKEKASSASQAMLNDLLPGGLGSLGSLFGK